MRVCFSASAAVLVALVGVSCGGSQPQTPQTNAAAPAGAPSAPAAVVVDKNAYPVFPDADAGADPSVPAEQGGKGFTGQGWQTNKDFDLIGDPRAVKGGTYREYQLDFPTTLRLNGPEANTVLNGMIGSMAYEALLGLHPTTLEYYPILATHWQVSADKLTYRFRLDPNARFSDGQPVTADDVVATWVLMMDKGLQDPMNVLIFAKYEKPVAESKYIVRVKSKVLNWRNFLYFSASLPILPAHVLKDVDGAKYVKDYNFKLLPGTGPYVVNEADVVKGKSVTIRRRKDYWGEKQRRNVGQNNFDEVVEVIVRDQKLALEMFKKGDLDFYPLTSRQWVEELNIDRAERGLIQKRKVYNDNPQGVVGLAFNTRKAPFDDPRLREAMALLLNRPLMIQKLFYNEYLPLNSYYAGGIYENPANPKNEYNPERGLKLLAEAGWKDRDAQGRLVKNGQPLSIELLYTGKTYEPAYTVYQDDLRKVGISLNLRFVTPETGFQLTSQRKFELAEQGWTGLVFPNPETSYDSHLADQNNTNNVTGIKNKRIDELLPIYDKEFDAQRRIAIIREVDGILAASREYILLWQAPYRRIAYWNKFGQPSGFFTRTGDFQDIPSLWWFDAKKQADLARGLSDATAKLPVGAVEERYWEVFGKQHPLADSTAATSH